MSMPANTSATMTADQVIATLGLAPHPEGRHYREIYRDQPGGGGQGDARGGRGAVTSIYYLLAAGEVSAWHRVDATEIWHHYAGAPLTLSISEDGVTVAPHSLGPDLSAGNARRRWCRPMRGNRRDPRGHGPWLAAPCRRRSNFPASRWRRPAGSRAGTDPGDGFPPPRENGAARSLTHSKKSPWDSRSQGPSTIVGEKR